MKKRKEFESIGPEQSTYVEQVKKRKKIILVNEDGTTEEYDSGVLITMTHDDKRATIVSKHCNTKPYIKIYTQGIGYLAMQMLENEESISDFYD